jgi:S-adenosylmethionine:diacylglycerol 3-amino-3-carboxypropyl transferase
MIIVEEKNRADIKRFVTGEINTLWSEVKHVAEPGASDFFKEVARNIVIQSGGTEFIQLDKTL